MRGEEKEKTIVHTESSNARPTLRSAVQDLPCKLCGSCTEGTQFKDIELRDVTMPAESGGAAASGRGKVSVGTPCKKLTDTSERAEEGKM